ncbi:MAG: S-layer homology domain-containing protein [Bacillota bacterium]|jgi:antitoxin component of MazEF toxin-antitoxin module/antitoxin (DNA-binding transcriptional repressor) of toxin-antitoxin stability system
MRRRTIVPLLALILTISMILAIPASTQAKANGKGWGRLKDLDKFMKKLAKSVEKFSDLRFADWKDAEWAIECIAKMRGLGIINGYGGNIFKPSQAVSQSEVLTMMVRAFDLENRAKELADRFSGFYVQVDKHHDRDDDNARHYILDGLVLPVVPSSARWALGYILVAVDEGWVKISELNPQASASREWVAMVMVRALGHEDQAQAKMNAPLPFTDAKAVSKDRVGYVAEAVAMGLFNGYPNGSFQPKKSVSRAEMAAILERFLEDELPDHTDFRVKGQVTSVSSTSIGLQTAGGQKITLTISRDVLVTLGGKAVSLDRVKAQDTVEVLTNGKGVALLIAIKKEAASPSSEVIGEIVALIWPPALTLDVDGQPTNVTIELATDCAITEGTKTISFESLGWGDRVRVKLISGKAVEIAVVARKGTIETISGIVSNVSIRNSGSTITLAMSNTSTSNTAFREINLASDVEVKYGERTLGVGDIRVGDSVTVRIDNGRATLVTIVSRGTGVRTITGVVKGLSISTSSYTITVATSNTSERKIQVSPTVMVRYGDNTLRFDDVLVGDTVTLQVQDDVCFSITITGRESTWGDVGGTIKTITQTADGTTLLLDRGSESDVRVKLASKVTITYGNTTLKPIDLRPGDVVRVKLENGLATEIRIMSKVATGS